MAPNLLKGYDDGYLECRRGNLGHVWRVLGYYRAPDGEVRRNLICSRCKTERLDQWNVKTGERLSARYKYSDGYVMEGNEVPISGEDIRREAMRRAKVFANEEQMLLALTEGGVRRGR